MAKDINPNRDEAFKIYKQHQGKISIKRIAKRLNESPRNIKYWKETDQWEKKYNPKGGAPLGNQNAIGNKSSTIFKEGNQAARKEGWYSKYYPVKSRNLIKEAEESGGTPLEILWAQIMTQWIAIIRAQELMYVDSREEMIKEVKKTKIKSKDRATEKTKTNESEEEFEYEFQFAWDRQATFLNAQSKAMAQLTNMIKRYDEMVHKNWDDATEEQKIRIENMKEKINIQKAKFAYDIQKDQGGNKDNELAKSVKAKMEQRKVEKK